MYLLRVYKHISTIKPFVIQNFFNYYFHQKNSQINKNSSLF